MLRSDQRSQGSSARGTRSPASQDVTGLRRIMRLVVQELGTGILGLKKIWDRDRSAAKNNRVRGR